MNNRPISVTLFAWFVLILAGINIFRLLIALVNWDFLLQYFVVTPLYLAITGFIWSIAFLVIFYGNWIGVKWVPRLTKLVLIAYLGYYWLDRMFFGNEIYRTGNLLFMILTSVFIVIWVFWMFSRQNVRKYYRVEEII
ncbi:hypothetical protein B5M50_06750 [candidate division KSB1 bacterium 4484_219]|nr:MAG: hypothetical protein B5M50_06750 [candidate division KSB1 bacterium 4484_219]